jgi:ABC-type amino acid transport substrate-binding protein
MKTARIVGLAVGLAVGGAAAQAAAPATSAAPLRLCADPANLPFSSNAPETAAAPGLYVEIGRAVAEALGRPMETFWSLSYFGKRNLRTTLLAGQCDLAIGLPATDDFMGPKLVFTRPILSLGYAIVVPKGRKAATLDDLAGQRVAVQFGSPPQSLVAQRDDITTVTVMDPEEAMRKLAAGQADAAYVWGPTAAYVNRSAMKEAYDVVPTSLQWPAAIGFSSRQATLRDEVDAVLPQLQLRIRELSEKYALVAAAPAVTMTDAGPVAVQAAAPAQGPSSGGAGKANATAGREIFDGTCAHCHGPNAVVADRKINLRLLQRKYGDQMEDVFLTTVTNGRPTKGMPTWKDVFKHQDFLDILAYLKTVQEP